MVFALEERRTSVASNFFLSLGPARTPACNQNHNSSTQHHHTSPYCARARGASGVRATSTLFSFCRRAAWSRLLDISAIPKSCAEKTGARVRNKNRSMEEPAGNGSKERKKWRVEVRKKEGVHGLRSNGNGLRASSPPDA